MTKRVIIDTDPGVDDAAALLLALASEELAVEMLTTTYGNGNVEDCTRNALILLDIAGRNDIPVYKGVNVPLLRDITYGYYVHGDNAFGGITFDAPSGDVEDKHAAQAIVDHVMANPGEITLIALGPVTNVALALALEPALAQNLKELIVMGGAVLTYGNASQVATANLWHDPEAAAIVYRSGAPIVQVGLDVCRDVLISEDEYKQLQDADTPTTNMLVEISPFLARHYQRTRFWPEGFYVEYNDVPAVAYAIDPSLFECDEAYVQISCHDELTRGQTVADIGHIRGQEPNTKILLEVDAPRLKQMLVNRLVNYQS
jgi:inosine-uridine nucleoside N-ribohydrolase